MLKRYQYKSEYNTLCYAKDMPKMVPIAPAPDRHHLTLDLSHKKHYKNGAQTASIERRNARERNRVKQVNDGFNALRKRLPATVVAALSGDAKRGSGKKLSKVDTLRMVVEYIKYLQGLIEESDAACGIQTSTSMDYSMQYEADEGICGGTSPYAESAPSPVGSECSSGVSSAYSQGYVPNYHNQVNYMEEDELFDGIAW
ncbi:achaete-scute complex protein T3 [Manduca sexta]|uniref:achaete-scute complex protein T3 n=1 Tax=Manduca sexta TaxID=7130 RepID=UPI0018908427|nr:achaete-scute complex protein T3 [Manduca sexta]